MGRLEMLEKLIKQGMATRKSSVHSDCIPVFDPKNENTSVHQWLEKIGQIKNVNNWDDITTMYSRLSGMSKS